MKTSTKTVISINNISKIYEGPPPVRALDGVSLEIKEGDFVSIVGQSGSGKSTFLNMIGLLDSTTNGSIEIEGKDVSELSFKLVMKISDGLPCSRISVPSRDRYVGTGA